MSVIEIYSAPEDAPHRVLLAMLVRPTVTKVPGAKYITEPTQEQQVARSFYGAGHCIEAHTHTKQRRTTEGSSEALVIIRGVMTIDIYDEQGRWMRNLLVRAGDTIVLAAGGHGMTMLEDVELVEIRQGPFLGDDKVFINGQSQQGSA